MPRFRRTVERIKEFEVSAEHISHKAMDLRKIKRHKVSARIELAELTGRRN